LLEGAWRADPVTGGFCVPNARTYPWQWLWDSCFHAVVWAHLGDERALVEVASALGPTDDDGFVPHVRYAGSTNPHEAFWGRPGTSSITQPPMYGHALAVASRAGMTPSPQLLETAARGLRFLLDRRRRSRGGLVELCHPWESGCDDSPRWDDLCPGGWTPSRWYDRKGALLGSVQRTPGGAPVSNDEFPVGSAGFSALVAFNALELASVTGDDGLRAAGRDLATTLDTRWDPAVATWVDDGPHARSGRVRTHDALLVALVSARPVAETLAPLVAPEAHGGAYGPASVHRAEPSFDPDRYWRGSSWPQLTYLAWLAATRGDARELAGVLADTLVAGALESGWAEHWNPDTGSGLGAAPQTWAALCCVAAVGR
jgi:glucosylglycerate hydrolase